MHIFENIWVRSEMVPIQGSDRKAKVYIPTFWGRLAWWVMPVDFIVLIFCSSMETKWVGLILLVALFISMAGIEVSSKALPAKECQRVLHGELVLRRGELIALNERRVGSVHPIIYYRFLLRHYRKNGSFRDELYNFPNFLYYQHPDYNRKDMFRYKRQIPVCLVEVAVLPPQDKEEFYDDDSILSYLDTRTLITKKPISRSRVVDIVYLEKLNYDCKLVTTHDTKFYCLPE